MQHAALPPCVDLPIPFLTQLDNVNVPYGTCNVTSIAMALKFLGIKGNGKGQLEDQLFSRVMKLGLSRHSPHDLAYLVNLDYGSLGIRDVFKDKATHAELKAHLAKGFPAIVHGFFTDSGHIIVVRGYDDTAYGGRGAYIVNDPYGEFYKDGYDTSASGERLYYSYRMMKDLAGSDGDFWVHFISKETVKK
jgi:Peptidase_C39 like family